jgi:hypothetical protein
MANPNSPFGARPVRHRSGAPFNGAARLYYVPASLAAMYVGDFVALAGSANTAEYYGNAPGTLPTVAIATSGTAVTSGSTTVLVGAVVGFFSEQATSPVYNPANTARGVWVADDPELVFEIQDDGVATLAATDVAGNYAINVATQSPSTATGRSGHTMGTTNDVTNVGAQLKMLGLSKRSKNALGQYAVWDVIINNHAYGSRVLGV